jgi:Ser/Thr protein kinase RdoA (MazF antagonist)
MHGDLHPGSVFVRGSDAILIDLASIQDGPLSGDLTCLEVALLFEPREGDDKTSEEAWQKAVDGFYAPESFRQLPPPVFGADSWSARLNCARQVKMVALPTQAATPNI